jgi:hypothetical protein
MAGTESVIESIITLRCLLVDYGEAAVLSDVLPWKDEHYAKFKMKQSAYNLITIFRKWFEYIIKTLYMYGFLFDTTPKGYSNVEMKLI